MAIIGWKKEKKWGQNWKIGEKGKVNQCSWKVYRPSSFVIWVATTGRECLQQLCTWLKYFTLANTRLFYSDSCYMIILNIRETPHSESVNPQCVNELKSSSIKRIMTISSLELIIIVCLPCNTCKGSRNFQPLSAVICTDLKMHLPLKGFISISKISTVSNRSLLHQQHFKYITWMCNFCDWTQSEVSSTLLI